MPEDVYYLSLPAESADQVCSLARYLMSHGVQATESGPDEVVCPVNPRQPSDITVIYTLHQCWLRFWEHSDAELYGISVYVKTSENCLECHDSR